MKIKKVIVDNASIYIDVDLANIDTVDLATLSAKFLGQCKGGLEFEAKPQIREMEFDGKLDRKIKGAERITGWDVQASTEALEFSDKVLSLSLLEKDTGVTSTKYDVYKGVQGFLADSNYHNVIIVGTVKDNDVPVIIELKNIINTDGFTFTAEELNEASYSMVLVPRYTMGSNTPPFSIYYPKDQA